MATTRWGRWLAAGHRVAYHWRITLPVPEPDRAYLRSIRRGERPLAEVLNAVTGAETRLAKLRESTAIPDAPDRHWVDD